MGGPKASTFKWKQIDNSKNYLNNSELHNVPIKELGGQWLLVTIDRDSNLGEFKPRGRLHTIQIIDGNRLPYTLIVGFRGPQWSPFRGWSFETITSNVIWILLRVKRGTTNLCYFRLPYIGKRLIYIFMVPTFENYSKLQKRLNNTIPMFWIHFLM